jgi:hypothetical protein
MHALILAGAVLVAASMLPALADIPGNPWRYTSNETWLLGCSLLLLGTALACRSALPRIMPLWHRLAWSAGYAATLSIIAATTTSDSRAFLIFIPALFVIASPQRPNPSASAGVKQNLQKNFSKN